MDQFSSRHKSRLLVALLLSGLVIGAAQAQAPKAPAASSTPAVTPAPAVSKPEGPPVWTPEPADKVVLKVGDQQFTKAQLDDLIEHLDPRAQQAIATQGRKQVGDQYATIVILSEQARLHHLDETPAFVNRLAFQKQQLEAQSAFEEISQQAKVTPEEVKQYYTTHAAEYDEIMVRQFVIRKKAPDPQTGPGNPSAPSGPGLTPEVAKARADAIRKELSSGTDIKKVLAESTPGEVVIDAEPRKVRRGAMRPEMEKVAFALKDGEISEPVDVPQALVFFQVTGHSHVELKDVAADVEKTLRQQRVDAALTEVKKNHTVWMDEQYFSAPPKPQERPTMGAPVVKIPQKP